MGRESTPDGRTMGRVLTPGDATAAATGLSTAAGGSARLRRASTDDRRSSWNSVDDRDDRDHRNSFTSFTSLHRRSSNFSDYSQDARDLLNPRPSFAPAEALRHQEPTSRWDALPLAFALLPAVGGLLVQGGGSFVTDVMLLALGGLFLHWSVTQPWTWYHAAQQIREEHEGAAAAEMAVEGEDDEDEVSPLEEDGADSDHAHAPTPDARVAAFNKKQRAARRRARLAFRQRQAAALRELYRHEVLALLACIAFPVVGAALLHALRGQLTLKRPSEGLISDFNLTVFLLAAEVRPLRHVLQLVQARTLHLQRIVHANPYREEEEEYRARRAQEERDQNQMLERVLERLARVEALAETAKPSTPTSYLPPSPPSPPATATVAREVRLQLQPELDTLARALRRTHKQQTMLETQVVAKFRATDQRLSDAVSLAAAAAGGTRTRPASSPYRAHAVDVAWAAVLWAVEVAVEAVLYLPRKAAAVVTAAITFVLAAVGRVTTKEPLKETKEAKAGKGTPVRRTPTIVGGHLFPSKATGIDPKPMRDLDYKYSTVASTVASGGRQRVGLVV